MSLDGDLPNRICVFRRDIYKQQKQNYLTAFGPRNESVLERDMKPLILLKTWRPQGCSPFTPVFIYV